MTTLVPLQLLECQGGPADGQMVAAQGREFVTGVPGSPVGHIYVRTLDDSGAMFWEYRGPLTND